MNQQRMPDNWRLGGSGTGPHALKLDERARCGRLCDVIYQGHFLVRATAPAPAA